MKTANETKQMAATDILISGAGMVGAAAALGFAQQGYHVTILDPDLQNEVDTQGNYDLRISAITQDNIRLLEDLGAWERIRKLRVHPFTELSVQAEGGSWLTMGDALGSDTLGYMVENSVLQHGLLQALQAQPSIHIIQSRLKSLNTIDSVATTEEGNEIQFAYALGCDGAQSKLRQCSGIGVAGRSYGQSCILSVVKTSQPVGAETWESFTKDGEIHALLPLANNQACLILYSSSDQARKWQSSAEYFNSILRQRFEKQIGDFEVLNSGSFPLNRQSALHYVKDRTILLGDAAHTIHPMAGQGVNLGFRDVKKLLNVVQGVDLTDRNQERSVRRALREYAVVRRADNEVMAQAMDSISGFFKQQNGPLPVLRNILLSSMQRIATARSMLTAYASGVWHIK